MIMVEDFSTEAQKKGCATLFDFNGWPTEICSVASQMGASRRCVLRSDSLIACVLARAELHLWPSAPACIPWRFPPCFASPSYQPWC